MGYACPKYAPFLLVWPASWHPFTLQRPLQTCALGYWAHTHHHSISPYAPMSCLQTYGLPPERVWVSVFENDEEAFSLWRDVIGVPVERIMRMGAADNFWASGATGLSLSLTLLMLYLAAFVTNHDGLPLPLSQQQQVVLAKMTPCTGVLLSPSLSSKPCVNLWLHL